MKLEEIIKFGEERSIKVVTRSGFAYVGYPMRISTETLEIYDQIEDIRSFIACVQIEAILFLESSKGEIKNEL